MINDLSLIFVHGDVQDQRRPLEAWNLKTGRIFLKMQHNVITRSAYHNMLIRRQNTAAENCVEHAEDQSPCRTHERNMSALVWRINWQTFGPQLRWESESELFPALVAVQCWWEPELSSPIMTLWNMFALNLHHVRAISSIESDSITFCVSVTNRVSWEIS